MQEPLSISRCALMPDLPQKSCLPAILQQAFQLGVEELLVPANNKTSGS